MSLSLTTDPSRMATPSPALQAPQVSPDQARYLNEHGATILMLDLPHATQLSFDYLSLTVTDKFRGIKMIPHGPHLCFLPASRSLVWLFEDSDGAVLVWRWNNDSKTLVPLSDSEDDYPRYVAGVRRYDFDSGLGPYQLQHWQRWQSLSSLVSKRVIDRVNERRRVEDDKYRSQYTLADKRLHYNDTSAGSSAECGNGRQSRSSDPVMKTMLRRQSKRAGSENDTLSQSTSTYYIPIPNIDVPDTLTPSQLSSLHHDQSDRLLSLMQSLCGEYHCSIDDAHQYLLGEFQHAFLSFLIGEDLVAFEHWRSVLLLLTQCERAVQSLTFHSLYLSFTMVLEAQLNEVSVDFFVDPLSANNFIEHAMQNLAEACDEPVVGNSDRDSDDLLVDERVKVGVARLLAVMEQRFGWHRRSVLDSTMNEDDEFAPVIVAATE